MDVVITEIIPFAEIDEETLSDWKEEVEECDWLYAKETDYFVKADLKVSDDKIEKIIFVLTIGKPASNSLCNGVCGPENAHKVYELNRLITEDNLSKNALSYFVGGVLRKLKGEDVDVSSTYRFGSLQPYRGESKTMSFYDY